MHHGDQLGNGTQRNLPESQQFPQNRLDEHAFVLGHDPGEVCAEHHRRDLEDQLFQVDIGWKQLLPDVSLRDQLDVDSMDLLNFMISLHKEFGVDIPERAYPQLMTIDGCVTHSSCLRHQLFTSTLAAWNAESDCRSRCLLRDGTLVVTQENGHVCVLKLYYGRRRISLAEAEALLHSSEKEMN